LIEGQEIEMEVVTFHIYPADVEGRRELLHDLALSISALELQLQRMNGF